MDKTEILAKKANVVAAELVKPVIVKPTVNEKSFAELVATADAGYTINKAYDLGGETVTLPHGVVLTFKGKGKLSNGKIVGDRGVIHADRRIFYNVQVEGTWDCVGQAHWFVSGCEIGETQAGVPFVKNYVDDFDGLQDALDSSFGEIVFSPLLIFVTETVVLRREKRLTLQGPSLSLGLESYPEAMRNATVIFARKDITLLEIMINDSYNQKSAAIVGGNFDVSLCENYTSSCIKVVSDNDERIWGLQIDTTIHGKYASSGGVGIDINPVENRKSVGYITDVRIESNIYSFGIGVKVRDYCDKATMTYYNWCSDVVIDGCISHCQVAVDSNADTDIRAMIQSGYFLGMKDNDAPLVRFSGLWATISSNVYDIGMKGDGGKWSNEYALEVADEDAMVTVSGMFEARYNACKKLGWKFVNGKICN